MDSATKEVHKDAGSGNDEGSISILEGSIRQILRINLRAHQKRLVQPSLSYFFPLISTDKCR